MQNEKTSDAQNKEGEEYCYNAWNSGPGAVSGTSKREISGKGLFD